MVFGTRTIDSCSKSMPTQHGTPACTRARACIGACLCVSAVGLVLWVGEQVQARVGGHVGADAGTGQLGWPAGGKDFWCRQPC